MADGLTPKQQRFVAEYLLDLNATQAAIKAGYSERSAGVEGARLLKNAKVAAAVRVAMDARAERTTVTADRVLAELAVIGFSDMRAFTSWGPEGIRLKASDALPEDAARCVAEVSETIGATGGSVRFKLHDKVGALEKIARHLGMFKDVVSLDGTFRVVLSDE